VVVSCRFIANGAPSVVYLIFFLTLSQPLTVPLFGIMAANEREKKLVAEDIEKDNRDVTDLWKDALKQYKGIVGFDLQPKFNNVQAMIDFGTGEMNAFHKFRHNSKKVDKLRSLFSANIDYIEKGAQQLISAATPAFPPAAAIGTAITYLLSVRLTSN
jgi:hypothetical protein